MNIKYNKEKDGCSRCQRNTIRHIWSGTRNTGVAHIADMYLLSTDAILRTAVIFFYTVNEGVSLLENVAGIGLPVPEKLKEALAQFHEYNAKNTKEDENH